MLRTRREIIVGGMKLAAVASVAGLVTELIPETSNARGATDLGRVPILQGMTDENSAQIRVLVEAKRPIGYRVLDLNGAEVSWSLLDRFQHPAWPDEFFETLRVTGLLPGQDYRFEVVDLGSGNLVDHRFFRALDTENPSAKFAVISCMNDEYHQYQARMWKAVQDASPDVIFSVGDVVYADKGGHDGSEGSLWKRSLQVRRRFDLYFWRRLVPFLATWDDHDFGVNNGDSTYKLKEATRVLFQAAYGWDATASLTQGPGVASVAKLFGKRFFLMDCRSFRVNEGPSKSLTHWGDEQEQWFYSHLSKDSAPAIILNGNQIFGGDYLFRESMRRDHQAQFERVMRHLSKATAPAVFASGDVHFSEISRLEPGLLGYESFELTSSSLFSAGFPGLRYIGHNQRRMVSTAKYNFLLVESRPGGSGEMRLQVTSIGEGSSEFFRSNLHVSRGPMSGALGL